MFIQDIEKVKAFVFDVDGVLTDGRIQVTENGDFMRSFHVKDGYAMQLALKKGYPIAIISGAKSKGVALRMQGLGITDVHLGVSQKWSVFVAFCEKHQLLPSDILFMGDDVPDVSIATKAGFVACPNDAIPEIKKLAHYICAQSGGNAAVREVIEKVLRVQNQWFDTEMDAHDGTISPF